MKTLAIPLLQLEVVKNIGTERCPDWKTPSYYFHMSLRWNFEAL